MEKIALLLQDYNYYRAKTRYLIEARKKKPNIGDVKEKNGYPALKEMDHWCGVHSIDSRKWLYFLFQRTGFQFGPKLTALIPNKKREWEVIDKFKKLHGAHLFEDRVYNQYQFKRVHSGDIHDANRDVSPMAERIKARYIAANQYKRCLDEMFVSGPDIYPTRGYHPKSKVCQNCIVARECITKLRAAVPAFDIIALRTGQLTLEQAAIADGRYYQR